jgi:hypothetical protein
MADRRSLTFIGLLYAGLTAAVMLTAGIVVGSHLSGRLSLEANAHPALSTTQR